MLRTKSLRLIKRCRCASALTALPSVLWQGKHLILAKERRSTGGFRGNSRPNESEKEDEETGEDRLQDQTLGKLVWTLWRRPRGDDSWQSRQLHFQLCWSVFLFAWNNSWRALWVYQKVHKRLHFIIDQKKGHLLQIWKAEKDGSDKYYTASSRKEGYRLLRTVNNAPSCWLMAHCWVLQGHLNQNKHIQVIQWRQVWAFGFQ